MALSRLPTSVFSSFTKKQKSSRVLGEDDIILVGACGTPAFLSPEASGSGSDIYYHGKPADVWAMGHHIIYLVSWAFYHFRARIEKTPRAVICSKNKLSWGSAKIPNDVKDLIKRILEKNPDKRVTLDIIASNPWVDVVNWKADLKEEDLSRAVKENEMVTTLSTPQNFRRTMKKKSRSLLFVGMRTATGIASSMMSIRPDFRTSKSSTKSLEVEETIPEAQSTSFLDTLKEWFACCATGEQGKEAKYTPLTEEGGQTQEDSFAKLFTWCLGDREKSS